MSKKTETMTIKAKRLKIRFDHLFVGSNAYAPKCVESKKAYNRKRIKKHDDFEDT